VHWRTLAKAKKRYRTTCYVLAGIHRIGASSGPGRFVVHLEFAPPSRRRHDVDNCVAATKAGLDGIADALGVDDSRFDIAAPRIVDPVRYGEVRVKVEQMP
jgi:crossover junction endodeoxyribonuclease RusA